VLAALSLAVAPAWPQQDVKTQKQMQETPQAAGDDDVEPKFIWGILIKIAVQKLSSYAFEAFAKYAFAKLSGGTAENMTLSSMVGLVRNSGALINFSRRGTEPVVESRVALAAAPIVVGDPDKPLVADGKKENYQGVHMALVVAQGGGQTFALRPVNEGFRTGERFKLRVLSTFGGELTIENINPRGERRQIYPPRPDQVVTLLPGSETMIPLDPGQMFEFAGATGREQLVINVIDPRAAGAAASKNKVFRQDTKYGSNFLQEATDGLYPSIQQSVELVHAAK
jgi:hypothetical protein